MRRVSGVLRNPNKDSAVTILERVDLSAIDAVLSEASADGWLLYDFKGVNPIARRIVGYGGMGTRRMFVWLPRDGAPVGIVHRIEQQGFEGFPGKLRVYASWKELHNLLGEVVHRKRVAMEVSPDDAVPYLDRVPAGTVQLVERLGGTVVPSSPLVSRFAARWSPLELEDHRKAAEALAGIARHAIARAVREAGAVRETEVQRRVLAAMDAEALVTPDAPIVAFAANAANPHYEPHEGSDAVLQPNDVVLVDLWAGTSRETVFADQTWMGVAGGTVADDVADVWDAVRGAREAVVEHLTRSASAGERVTGADLDDAARGLLVQRGFGEAFVHRTGHSIDLDLHGSGPNLDNFETNDTRQLLPGVGFSVEPGVYLEGRFGVRSEINVVLHEDGPEVTPSHRQEDLILPT
jgi:Xaa-Pro aminopeptidase